MKRVCLLVATITFAASSSACYGQYATLQRIHRWNGRATSSRFVNSLIHLGFYVIPVYEVAWAADFLLFNTIEALTGSNPMASVDGDTVRFKYAGHDYQLLPTADAEVEVLRDGIPEIRYRRDGDRVVVTDMAGHTLDVIDAPTADGQRTQAMAVAR